jgi:serine/threonine-protein kinase
MTTVSSPLADALRDRYLLERQLGRGGMATVYLVQDLKHDRLVALKVMAGFMGSLRGQAGMGEWQCLSRADRRPHRPA